MEAEEPEHGASAPSPAIADFPTVPGAIMRSSQIPSLEPEAQEGQDPSYMWADGHGLLLKQPKDLKNMSDHPPDSVGFFSKEVSSDVESSQEILVAEACDTPDLQEAVSQSLQDRLSRTIAAPELLACGGQEEWLDKSSQLDSRVEAELQPELMSLTLSIRTAKEEEETPPDTSTARGSWPPCRKHPGETEQSEGQGSELRRQGKQPQLEDTQEKQGQEGLLHPLEEQEGQEVEIQEEGTLREDICSDGLLGEQEEEGEEVNGNEDEQKQDKDQNHIVLGTQRESEGLSGELGGLDYSECGQEDWDRKVQGQRDSEEEGQGREFREVEERRANVQFAEEQRLVQSENGSGKQAEHGEAGKAVPVEGQEEVLDSGEGELESGGRGGQAVEEGRRTEDDKCCPLVDPVASEGLSPGSLCPGISCSDSLGVQRNPVPTELLPQALTSALETTKWSQQPISPSASFATEEPLEDRTHNSQQEGVRLRKGGVSIQGAEVVSASVSVTPRTPDSAPFGSPEVFPLAASLSPVSTQPVLPGKDTLTACLSADTSPHCGAFETPPLPVKTTQDPCATSDKANQHSPLCSYPGATQHLRSNSFPGFHRTEQTLDSGGMSSSFSHSELPQRPPKPAIYGSLIPRRDRRSRDGIIFSESSTAFLPLRQDSREFASNPEGPSDPHDSQLWSSPQSSTLATGSPVPASSPSTVSMDMRIHETLPPPPPVKRHSYSSVMERDRHLHAVSPALKRHSHPSPLALSSGLHGSPKGPFPLVPDSVVARQHRPLPSTPEDPHHAQTSIPPRLRYNKPLPPTPDAPELCHSLSSSSSVPKKYRPLPPVPPSEPPPLPPKSRERSRSIQWGVRHPGGQANPRPTGQDWTTSTLSVGRTSWPPATGRSTDSLAATSRSNSEVSPGLAFSNMTNLLCPSSPTTPWIPQLQRPASKDEIGLPEESESPVRGSFRRSGPQERYNDTRRSSLGPTKQSEKPIHHQLEKTSSCPDRQDPVRTEGGSELAVSQASNKLKSWNRQGLRRPSLSPESASGKWGAESAERSLLGEGFLLVHPSPGSLLSSLQPHSAAHLPSTQKLKLMAP